MRLACVLLLSAAVLASPLERADAAEAEAPCPPPESQGEAIELSREAADAFLDELFAYYEKVERLSANLAQTKRGGVFKNPQRKAGTLKLQAPDRFVVDLSEHGLRIVGDGRYIWLHDTEFGDVERYDAPGQGAATGDTPAAQAGALGALVALGQGTVEELRRTYEVTALRGRGLDGARQTKLRLVPRDRDPGDPQRLLFVFPHAEFIPHEIALVGPDPGAGREPTVTTVHLSETSTNVDGLEPFPEETFMFEPKEHMEIRDMSAEGARRISIDEARQAAASAPGG